MVNSNFPTFPNFDFPAFWAEKFFPNMPACRRAGPARKNDFQKFSSTMLVWYLFGKFRLNRAKWWRNYQNRTIFGRFMDVWSRLDVLMTSSGIIWQRPVLPALSAPAAKIFFFWFILTWGCSIPNFSPVSLLKRKKKAGGPFGPPPPGPQIVQIARSQ